MAFRRCRAIAWATALEVFCEPLVLLTLVVSAALAALAPALHYHQFGDATRMARDAGISSMLVGGSIVAFFAPLKTVRRELETGTAQMALSRAVSRTEFFLSKVLGCMLAHMAFSATVAMVSLTVVRGAVIGAGIAETSGQLARIWGPSLAFALSVGVLPLVFAAALNRFWNFRFVPTACMLALLLSAAGAIYRFDALLAARLVPALVLAAAPSAVLLAVSAALAVRFKGNAVSSMCAVFCAVMLPALGNYCLSDALSDGGAIGAGYFLFAVLALAPAVAAALAAGVWLINGRDVA